MFYIFWVWSTKDILLFYRFDIVIIIVCFLQKNEAWQVKDDVEWVIIVFPDTVRCDYFFFTIKVVINSKSNNITGCTFVVNVEKYEKIGRGLIMKWFVYLELYIQRLLLINYRISVPQKHIPQDGTVFFPHFRKI